MNGILKPGKFLKRISIWFGAMVLASRGWCAPAVDYEVYVTNERSGDITIIDGVSGKVAATIPV